MIFWYWEKIKHKYIDRLTDGRRTKTNNQKENLISAFTSSRVDKKVLQKYENIFRFSCFTVTISAAGILNWPCSGILSHQYIPDIADFEKHCTYLWQLKHLGWYGKPVDIFIHKSTLKSTSIWTWIMYL